MLRFALFRLPLYAILAVLCWFGPQGTARADDPIGAALAGAGIDVVQVEAGPGWLRVAFEAPLAADANAMVATALQIMDAAVDLAPDACDLAVRVHYVGEPMLEIAARADDVRAVREGRLDPVSFAERLALTDLAAPAAARGLDNRGAVPGGSARGLADGVTSDGSPEGADVPEVARPPLVTPTETPAGPGAVAFPELAPPPWP